MAENNGKKFEEDFKNSFDCNRYLVKRLNDNASSFAGGANTRFTSTNECDFIILDDSSLSLFCLELKTSKNSLTFWREDFESNKKQSFQIKKNQVLGLEKFNNHKCVCGFVINFYENNNRTFFISITNFLGYTKNLDKKSININDVINMNPYEITSTKKRTRYSYEVDEFTKDNKVSY